MISPLSPIDTIDWLHEAASARSGLHDFGDSDYRRSLKVLLDALDHDPRIVDRNRPFPLGVLTAALVARLYTQEGWRRHPEHAQVRIQRPLIITGIPRTGTTALHKLLSMDEQFQGIERWLTATPMPRPPRSSWAEIAEFKNCAAGLEAFLQAVPEMAIAHDMTPDTVDECLEVLQQSFISNRFASSLDVPAYRDWWYAQDEQASYERYANVLRLIGVLQPTTPWLLKNPGHLWGIESLLKVFPDACIVQTHRDPAAALPSLSSVLELALRVYLGDGVRAVEIGPVEADKWLRAIGRMERARQRQPERFYDVWHSEFRRDPLRIVRGIYERFEITLSAETEARMCRWLAEQSVEQKSGRRVSPETYGLTARGLRAQYSDYIERYNLHSRKNA